MWTAAGAGGCTWALCVPMGYDQMGLQSTVPTTVKKQHPNAWSLPCLCPQGSATEGNLATTTAAEETPGVHSSTARNMEFGYTTAGTPVLTVPTEHSGEGPSTVSCSEPVHRLSVPDAVSFWAREWSVWFNCAGCGF